MESSRSDFLSKRCVRWLEPIAHPGLDSDREANVACCAVGARSIEPNAYQNSVSRIVGASRRVPDVAAVANPVTGVWTYVSAQGGWLIVGGTSLGSPLVAAVVNNAGHFSLSTAVELSMTYNDPDYSHFSDIKDGTCGPHEGYFAASGWDFCAGLGSPRVKGGSVADK